MSKALFNINRLVADSGKEKDISPEMSFLQDLDYTCRQMSVHKPYYYFKLITKQADPEYFDNSEKCVNVICLDELPETNDGTYYFERTNSILHTNDQKYYVCLYADGKPSKKYKPSSLHCLRQMYYQITGADMDEQGQREASFYAICESGEDRHIRIQRAISSMRHHGVDCDFVDVEQYVKSNNLPLEIVSKKEFETKLYDRARNLIFLCDGIIKYKGKYYIIEIKTQSSFRYMNTKSIADVHKYQAYTYSLEFGIDDVIFLYENRDLCWKKTFMLHVTDADRQFIIDRLSQCDRAVEIQSVPNAERFEDKKICQYCEYKTRCKLDGGFDESAEPRQGF